MPWDEWEQLKAQAAEDLPQAHFLGFVTQGIGGNTNRAAPS
ncbi:hypothetical protein ACFYN0_06605 [Streptomyces sp. NPDC006704]